MCAYNRINGQPACANDFLLVDQLRGKWGFQGYVVSDCDAVSDIFHTHNYTPGMPEAIALAIQHGEDNECADFFQKVKDDHDYKAYIDAVHQGLLKESDLDTPLIRLFTARMKLGIFDPPEMVPYSKIDEKLLDSAEHRALARKLANESMVLLKNDGTLPIKSTGTKLLVVGPLADQTHVLLGNYNGIPSHTVTILEGIKKEFSNVTYVEGTQFLGETAAAVPASVLTTGGKPGLAASYSDMATVNMFSPEPPKVIATRTEPSIDVSKPVPDELKGKRVAIRWDATLTAPDTAEYNLGMRANGFFRVSLDGKEVASGFSFNGAEAHLGRVQLEKGHAYKLEATWGQPENGTPEAKLVWSKVDLAPQPAALEAAKKADVVVAVVGITSRLEGEEMNVTEPGFKGGDRTSLDLPKPEEDLIEALAKTGKPLVVVLTNGSALSVNWASQHANAILDSWYAGEEGGAAVAETLSGKNNPAGRLPVTFYTGVDQLPAFENYFMRGRTYRYFTGKPLYPFGYGLSYTTFSYSNLSLPTSAVQAGSPIAADVTVTNTGKLAGDEVAELYLSFPEVKGAPIRALRAFQRVHLDPGASTTVHFDLKPRDLSMVTDAGEILIPEGKYSVSIGGGQPDTSAPTAAGTFTISGSQTLPE
jgi:beta-glucosidase